MQPSPPFFVFDGDCGFCRKWARWLQRKMPADSIFVPYQEIEDLNAHGLDVDGVKTASYWIDPAGKPHRGADSFAGALHLANLPWRGLGAVLRAPGIRSIARSAYAVIARNRHRLPAPADD